MARVRFRFSGKNSPKKKNLVASQALLFNMEKHDAEHGDTMSAEGKPTMLAAELQHNLEAGRDEPMGLQNLTPEEQAMNRRVSLKMDLALLPLLSLLYLFNGLDKSNVGNAQTQGELIEESSIRET